MRSESLSVSRLPNGLVLATESLAGVASVGVTWLVPGGVARDPADRVGLSGLHAELLLRGAGDLGSREQADAFDALGASRDTTVGTLSTAVRSTLLGSNLAEALPLVWDMIRRPSMSSDQFEAAQSLCLQSLASLADEPAERVMLNVRSIHAPSPLSRSTRGTREGLEASVADEMAGTWRERAVAGGSVLAIAGDVKHASVQEQVSSLTEGWSGTATEVVAEGKPPRGLTQETDQTDQTHIAIAHDAPPETSDDSWCERVATAVLSGGMSGRLFSELREKRSLCYSVHASYGAERDYGRTVAYVGTTPERAQESLDVLSHELHRLGDAAGRVTQDEFDRAVVGLKSRLVFSGESSAARASAIAHDIRKLGSPRSLGDLVAGIEGVTLKGLNAYLERRELGEMSIATVGPKNLTQPDQA